MMRHTAMAQFMPHVNEVADDFIHRLRSLEETHDTYEVPNLRNEILKWTLESEYCQNG